MAIEAISGAGMTYQGSSSTAKVRQETQVKTESSEVQVTSEKLATETSAIDAKAMDNEGEGGENNNQSFEQQSQAIHKAVEDINKRANNTTAVFGVHEATNRITIKLVDKDTKEVIRELPPEKTLDMIAKVWEMAGLLVDEKR